MDVKHIAGLARIKLTQEEEDKMKEELSKILGYISELNKVNTDGVEPLFQTTGILNSMRDDQHRGDFKMDEGLGNKLIGQAPGKEGRFIKVKSILQK
jgi:aspartyl-tRNA(Asn)/glutamyl-tRNA(Gln) amidotransferase subunit C